MTESHDPLFEAIAGLPTIAPDANWERRVRARCRSQIARHAARQAQAGRGAVRKLTLIDLAALALLLVYWSALLRETARLGGLL